MFQPRPARNLSIDSILDQLRTSCAAMLVVLLACLTVASAQQRRQQLSRIEIVGLKRLTQQHVITTSGLEIGQTVDQKILDAAGQKLMDSGLFKKLSFHVRSTGDQVTVTFAVEEAVRRMPVFFDNFAWFTDEEIYIAVRRDVNFFDGTVPEDGDTAAKVAASLRRLLDEKKIAGRVEYMPIGDESGRQQLLFSVKDANLAVCSLHFPGASAIAEDELVKSAGSLLRTEYSRKDVGLFAQHTLLPLYRHAGYWRAQISPPTTIVGSTESDACKDGVAVTMYVDEGLQYSWDRAEWSGNRTLSSDQLTATLGMKAGDVADDRKFDKALLQVRREYAKKGYMALELDPSAAFDDTSHLVSYRFKVSEGPQYHMGEVAITGLSDEDSRRVKELWQLAPGSVFDQSYVDQFVTKSVREFLDRHPVFSGVPLKVGVETKPDPKKEAVDIVITFK